MITNKTKPKLILCLLPWLFCLGAPAAPAQAAPAPAQAAPAQQAAPSGYRLPPAALQAVVDAPRVPMLVLSPGRNLATMVQRPTLPGIREVAQPELKLAGLRINPRTYAASRFLFGQGLHLLDLATQKETPIDGLPASLRIADSEWSPDQRYFAFSHHALGDEDNSAGVELWLVDIAKRSARKLGEQALHAVHGKGFAWMPDSLALLVHLKPANPGPAPMASGIPNGPNAQDSQADGKARQLRTYPDLLKNDDDIRLFAHYARNQLALIDLTGKTRAIGKPDFFTNASVSPNGQYLLTQKIEAPFSTLVPQNSFPERIEIRAINGEPVHTLATLPLEEGLPPGNDAVRPGVRAASWRADAAASVVWAEAQDGGDPNRKLDAPAVRDIVYMQAAPFDAPPQVLARLGMRFSEVLWGRGDLALIREDWHKTRVYQQWQIAPDAPAKAAVLVFGGSSEDRYQAPGDPVTQADAAGHQRLSILAANTPDESILLIGEGASAEGDRPFIARFNLKTKSSTQLFRSAAPYFERVAAVLDQEGRDLLSWREAPTERPNYFIRHLSLATDAQLTALTHFPHPLPQLKDVQKEKIRYKRADGVDLNATLYLPPRYEAKRDGPLPLLMWAYPHEFKSASAASQVTGSPYMFNSISYSNAQAFVAMGYAVLDNPSMPIIGEGEKEPNDTYLQQLIASAQAAVDEVVRRGVADRHRIAIGGHSYGAFMTANLLAHTRLFRAGLARSGAYNRTLTPFGFQAEERQFWQAKEIYQAMSPFNYADKIKDALLLVHGEQDNNPGTFPIQSERMFQALKGLGARARLVMLPNESHGYRARESIMHMLAESNDWLETYVKNAPPPVAPLEQ